MDTFILIVFWERIYTVLTDDFYGSVILAVTVALAIYFAMRNANHIALGYNPPVPIVGGMQGSVEGHLFRPGPPFRIEFSTNNHCNQLWEANYPIQAVRFVSPSSQIIRPECTPVYIDCEPSLWKRLRNKVKGVPPPRLIVQRFTEKGVVIHEENTRGTNVVLEFTPTASNRSDEGEATGVDVTWERNSSGVVGAGVGVASMNYITLKVTNLPGIPLDVEVQAVKTVKYAAKECLAALIDHDMVHPCIGYDDPVIMIRASEYTNPSETILDQDGIVADLDGESVKVLLVADVA